MHKYESRKKEKLRKKAGQKERPTMNVCRRQRIGKTVETIVKCIVSSLLKHFVLWRKVDNLNQKKNPIL